MSKSEDRRTDELMLRIFSGEKLVRNDNPVDPEKFEYVGLNDLREDSESFRYLVDHYGIVGHFSAHEGCDNCDNRELRWAFIFRDKENKEIIIVGAECVKSFKSDSRLQSDFATIKN